MPDIRLNKEQKEAVEYNRGPLLIVAGAGTGKTSVLVEKIKYLIEKKLATPPEILALTFTERAAAEMEERVDQAMPYGYFQMAISTFHSFADLVLRQEAHHIGLPTGYRLMTTAENILFMRSHLFLFNLKYFRPLGNPTKFLEGLLQHFSRLRDEDVSPAQYFLYAKRLQKKRGVEREEKEKMLELARTYMAYEKLKVREGVMDFSDLIYYVLLLFRKRKNILNRYRAQFRYVLVDEFQDTNICQYLLLKELCPPSARPHLTVVGDDSQAIYKFRGASVSNILSFMNDYKRARQVTLRRNYRSIQPILDASYRLIKFNDPDTLEAQLGISKNLVAARGKHLSEEQYARARGLPTEPQAAKPEHRRGKARAGIWDEDSEVRTPPPQDPVSYHLFNSFDKEAEFVAKEIVKLRASYKLSDIAILARANNHLQAFTRTLAQQGILYQFHGPSLLLKDQDVRDMIAYLNVLVDPDDSISAYRVLNMQEFDIPQRDLALILAFARRVNLTLYQAIEAILAKKGGIYNKYLPTIAARVKTQLTTIFAMINRHLKLRKRETAGQILYYFLEDTGILAGLSRVDNPEEERRTLSLSKFFSMLRAYETSHEDASVFAVTDFIKMHEELGDSPILEAQDKADYDAVHLLTVHGAKGLEFPVVFMVNLVQGRFPTRSRAEVIPIPDPLIKEVLPVGDYHLQEERRLFYVGMTRAADRLILTAASYYGEGKRARKVSPFVVEAIGQEYVKKLSAIQEEEKAQLSILEYKKKPEVIVRVKQPINTFSYSALETFLTCPRQYKLKYILRIPAPQTSAESLGSSVHLALEEFYNEHKNQRKPDLKRLLELYRTNWIPIGYSSIAHQLKAKRDGEVMLKSYYKNFRDAKIKLIDVERSFTIKLSDFKIVGKMDRVDELKGGAIEIIDYKTGRMPDEKKIRTSLQLKIYFLAAAARGIYGKNPSDITLTYHYLQAGEKISIQKNEEDIPAIKEEINKIVEAIRTSDFSHRKGPWCDFCPYRDICCFAHE